MTGLLPSTSSGSFQSKISLVYSKRRLLPLIPILIFLLTWQGLAKTNIINPALFPPPIEIIGELIALYQREILLSHIGATLKRTMMAALGGGLVGMIVGLLVGINRDVYRFLEPLIAIIMPIPGIAMAPLFIIWLGFGNPTIITVGAIAAFFPILYNTVAGVRSINQQLVRAARIMGAGPATILAEIYLPSAAGYILVGIKLGLARCWRTVIAVEFIAAANWGIGYMIWDASEYLQAGVVYGGIALLIMIYIVLDKGLIATVESQTIEKWGTIRQ